MNFRNAVAQQDAATPVALLAVGNRDSALLELMLQRFLRDEFVIVPAARAAMVIIDGDSAGGAEALAHWLARCRSAPTIVLTLQPQVNTANVIYIRKPINIHTLIDMLSELRPFARRPAIAVEMAQPRAEAAASFSSEPEVLAHAAASPGPIVVGDEDSNRVVSVEICMSNDLDEIFSASDVQGPGFAPASPQAADPQPGASREGRNSTLLRNILARLDVATN
jgi:hypothetical protein